MIHSINRIALATSAVLGALVAVPTTGAAAAPTFRVPFPCSQVWTGSTHGGDGFAAGTDFNRRNDLGDAVVASARGRVVRVRRADTGYYGRTVLVAHGDGWTTYYAHLRSVQVQPGQRVRAGSLLGTVGHSGAAHRAHLHFEQRHDGRVVSLRFHDMLFPPGTRRFRSSNACPMRPHEPRDPVATAFAARQDGVPTR